MKRRFGWRLVARTRVLAVVGATLALGACNVIPYYSQAIAGEFSLLRAARPIDDWLRDPATPEALRTQLRLAAQIRVFASREIGLPDNDSYRRYADLHRSSALWNVFAAPADSLELKTWCYPLIGCAAYRGYFERAAAQSLAANLAQAGLDTYVAPVPAFSTLGWFADPLLNTFVQWPEPELARLIFHELAHQIVYVRDDTRFNESFATCVERAGLARWVASRDDASLREQYGLYQQRHADVLQLLQQTRTALAQAYAPALAPAERVLRKERAFAQMLANYRAVRDQRWGGYRGYDAFFETPWNNARIAAMAAYTDEVPAFDALLARENGDLPRFFAQVRRIAALPQVDRNAALRALAPAAPAEQTAAVATPLAPQ